MLQIGRKPCRFGQLPYTSAPVRARAMAAAGDVDPVAVDLLRHLDPDHLLLYGGRRPDRTEWRRHCLQRSEYVLAATRGPAAARQVVGTLELRIQSAADGEWGMIDRLYVDPLHRRLGIASRLLRAAITFARGHGLVSLRESIPNVLVRDPADNRWHAHIPAGDGWGGLRSLGATVNACVREGQPCAIERASRLDETCRIAERPEGARIGAILILPFARPRPPAAPSRAVLLDRLLAELARAAGVALDAACATEERGDPTHARAARKSP